MERITKDERRYRAKCRDILMRLAKLSKGRTNQCVPFAELGVKFQDYHCLDLRDKGLVHLGVDNDGHCGILLNRAYQGLSMQELAEVMNLVIGKLYDDR